MFYVTATWIECWVALVMLDFKSGCPVFVVPHTSSSKRRYQHQDRAVQAVSLPAVQSNDLLQAVAWPTNVVVVAVVVVVRELRSTVSRPSNLFIYCIFVPNKQQLARHPFSYCIFRPLLQQMSWPVS